MLNTNTPYSLFIKAEGAKCNLDCSYCYYLNNQTSEAQKSSMCEALMHELVKEHIASQPEHVQLVDFIWHGGEPMLRGLDFYQSAIQQQALQQGNRHIKNTLQTNGTLINERWASFFAEHNFMLGVSIDGPNILNDIARIDKNGKSSFERTMRGIDHLKAHNVEFNTLTVVNNKTYRYGKTIYQFLKDSGSQYMQFQPCIDHELDRRSEYDWTLTGKQWGHFLCEIFDAWVEKDVGKVYIQFFENCLMVLMDQPSQMCHHSAQCGQQLMIEHDGKVYSCDHYGYEDHQVGDFNDQPLVDIVNSEQQQSFAKNKNSNLSSKCLQCDFLPLCNGGCPKNRIATTATGEVQNQLCEGYEMFFIHALPKLLAMVDAMKKGHSPVYYPLFN